MAKSQNKPKREKKKKTFDSAQRRDKAKMQEHERRIGRRDSPRKGYEDPVWAARFPLPGVDNVETQSQEAKEEVSPDI